MSRWTWHTKLLGKRMEWWWQRWHQWQQEQHHLWGYPQAHAEATQQIEWFWSLRTALLSSDGKSSQGHWQFSREGSIFQDVAQDQEGQCCQQGLKARAAFDALVTTFSESPPFLLPPLFKKLSTTSSDTDSVAASTTAHKTTTHGKASNAGSLATSTVVKESHQQPYLSYIDLKHPEASCNFEAHFINGMTHNKW